MKKDGERDEEKGIYEIHYILLFMTQRYMAGLNN